MRESIYIQRFLIFIAASFLFVMLILPMGLVAKEALAKGFDVYLKALTDPFALKALYLTVEATILAVLLNTIFGLASAWLLTNIAGKSRRSGFRSAWNNSRDRVRNVPIHNPRISSGYGVAGTF